MDTLDFLNLVITAPQGYFCLATYDDTWREQWFDWPDQSRAIVEEASKYECDVYFSSYLFDSKNSKKQSVLPTRTIQADLDNADVQMIDAPPSVLVQTSRDRHQGFWLLNEQLEKPAHEALSKKITYGIPYCDHSGWALGRKVRLPNTFNCKYNDRQEIRVVSVNERRYDRNELELAFIAEIESQERQDDGLEDFLDNPLTEFDVGPQEFLERVRDKMPPKVMAQYNVIGEDRSRELWALECSCFRAGLNRYETYYLAFHSANNKFKDLRINGMRELAKDVLRAEVSGAIDPKTAIASVRTIRLPQAERKRAIAEASISLMKSLGTFARSRNTIGWYVHQGQPIPVMHRSGPLHAFLENQLGLNATEPEQHFVTNALISYTAGLPPTAMTAALSYYDIHKNTLHLHTGRKQVLKINHGGLTHSINGSENLIFPWQQTFEPFVPLESNINWAEVLFGDTIDEVIGISKNEALVLLKVWFLFMLLRNLAEARPILAILGQPGAGKSAMLRRVYAVLYGSEKKIGGVTNPGDFDTQTSNFPFVVFDNVDTWEGWLPDRLAQVINNTDIDRRKLYTDNEVYSIKREAMVALTAHDPKFGRADVVDRLLILNVKRVPEFKDEKSMVQGILDKRNYIWGAIIDDLLTITRTPRFIDNSLQFRIQDFASIGVWISRALSIEQEFRNVINTARKMQRGFIVEEEDMLVDVMQRAAVRNRVFKQWVPISTIWAELELLAMDPIAFQKRYKNTTVLTRRLQTLQDALSGIFTIKWKDEDGRRLWWIEEK